VVSLKRETGSRELLGPIAVLVLEGNQAANLLKHGGCDQTFEWCQQLRLAGWHMQYGQRPKQAPAVKSTIVEFALVRDTGEAFAPILTEQRGKTDDGPLSTRAYVTSISVLNADEGSDVLGQSKLGPGFEEGIHGFISLC
jgi:hypothetical protein